MSLRADIQKVNSFARSEFCLIKFWAELCTEIAIKHIRFEKFWKKCFFLASFTFKSQKIAQILEKFVRTCVHVSMHF